MNSALAAIARALGGISPEISEEHAKRICESLKQKSPKLFEKIAPLYEKNRERYPFDDRSFDSFVADLVYMQTRASLSMQHSVGHLRPVCNTRFGCRCCESFNEGVERHAYKKAEEDISNMLKDPSASYSLFHGFAELAVQNEMERQSFLDSEAERVYSPPQVATALQVAEIQQYPESADDSAMYD